MNPFDQNEGRLPTQNTETTGNSSNLQQASFDILKESDLFGADTSNNPNNSSNPFEAFDSIQLVGGTSTKDQSSSTGFDPFASDDFFFFDQPSTTNTLRSSASQKGKQVAPWRATSWNASDYQKKADFVFTSSSKHASILVLKQQKELESQQLHNGLWSFPIQQRTANGICADERRVMYMFSVRIASLNEHLYGVLGIKFNELHALNINEVFSTLYDQTIAELQLSNYIYGTLPTLKKDIKSLKQTLDILFDFLHPKKPPVSGHTAQNLRHFILYIGSHVLDMIPNSSTDNTLITFHDEPDFQQVKSVIPNIPTYFFTKLMGISGCVWGSTLIQPSELDVIQYKWLEMLFVNPPTLYEENEYILLLAQVPWVNLVNRPIEDIKKNILLPLQKGMELLAPKPNFLRLLLLLGKIVVIISHQFPSLILQCVAILTRSPWPSKMVFSPLFNFLPWKQLQKDDLLLIFTELYQLYNQKVKDYATVPEEQKYKHRIQQRDYATLNQYLITQAYTADPQLSAVTDKSRFPLFTVFTTLAALVHQKGDETLAKVVSQELFYYSFLCPGSPAKPSQPNDPMLWMPYLRTEASTQLGRLCKLVAPTLSWAINTVGQVLPHLNPQQIEYFIGNQVDTNDWLIDLGSLNWLSYLLSHRGLPATTGTVTPDQRAEILLNTFLLAKPSLQFQANVNMSGIFIGCKLFERVQWELCDPVTRMIGLLILLSSKSIGVNPEWIWKMLSSDSIGQELLGLPYDNAFVQRILALQPHQLFCEDELILSQISISLNMIDERARQQGYKWLEDWGFYQRVETLIQKRAFKGTSLQNLFVKLMNVLKYDPQRTAIGISKCIASALKVNGLQDMRAVLARTLSLSEHEKWVPLWCTILCVRAPEDPGFCNLLNSFIHALFCEQASLDIVLNGLMPKQQQLSRKEVHKLETDYFWLGYALLMGHQPGYPRSAGPTASDSAFQKALKESRFWLLKEVAMNTKDGILALIFWEQFFMLYFEAASVSPTLAGKLVSNSLREQLNKHFSHVAQIYLNNKSMYTLYYSFTTWAKDVIFGDKDRIFSVNDPIYLSILIGAHPPFANTTSTQSESSEHQSTAVTVALQKLQLNDDSDSFKQLMQLMPRPVAKYIRTGKEHEGFVGFQQELEEALCALELMREGNNEEELPLVEDFRHLFSQYHHMSDDLKAVDASFLQLTRNMYQNFPENFRVSVPCSYGASCAGRATITATGVRIAPATATLRDDMFKNRDNFNKSYAKYFSIARSIAFKQSVLEYLKQYFIQEGKPRTIDAAHLYLSLIPLLFENNIPLDTIGNRFFTSMKELGEVFIKNKIEYQKILLKIILKSATKSSDSKTRVNEKYQVTHIFSCFTPTSFLILPVADRTSYLELLKVLATKKTALSAELENALSARFEIEKYFPLILPNFEDYEIESLFNLLPALMAKGSLNALCGVIIQHLILFSFPKYLDPVISTVLTAVVNGAVSNNWHELFMSVTWDKLDSIVGQKILRTISSRLPLPDKYMPSAIVLARSVVLEIPGFVSELMEQNQPDFIWPPGSKDEPQPSVLWNDIVDFLEASLKPYRDETMQPHYLSDGNVNNLFYLLNDLVRQVCPGIVNRIWYLYNSIFVPFMTTATQIESKVLHDALARLPWNDAVFHYRDAKVVKMMTHSLLHVDYYAMGLLLNKLPWRKYSQYVVQSAVNNPEESQKYGKMALDYLEFFIATSSVAPSLVPEGLKDATYSMDIGHPATLYPWKDLNLSAFDSVFTGATFISIVKAAGTRDPSKVIVDALVFLHDLLLHHPHLQQASLALAIETRSLMFFSLQSAHQQQLYWSLPFQDHVTLLTAVLIPITRAHSKSAKISTQVLASILSCLNHHDVWPVPTLVKTPRPQTFFNTSFIPGVQKRSEAEQKSLKEFSSKVRGIISQFAASVPEETAIDILNIGAQAISEPSSLVEIFEETLHSYFSQTNSSNPVGSILANLQIPGDDMKSFVDTCITHHAPLCLFTAMSKKWNAFDRSLDSSYWTSYSCQFIESVIAFTPHNAHYLLDTIILWFFILDVVSHPKWETDKFSDSALKQFRKHLKQYSGTKKKFKVMSAPKVKSVELQLAARAILLYLSRIQLQKKVESLSHHTDDLQASRNEELVHDDKEEGKSLTKTKKDASKKLTEYQDKILEGRSDPVYQSFSSYFSQVETYLSPLCSLQDFKLSLIKTLAPIYPYMEKIVSTQ